MSRSVTVANVCPAWQRAAARRSPAAASPAACTASKSGPRGRGRTELAPCPRLHPLLPAACCGCCAGAGSARPQPCAPASCSAPAGHEDSHHSPVVHWRAPSRPHSSSSQPASASVKAAARSAPGGGIVGPPSRRVARRGAQARPASRLEGGWVRTRVYVQHSQQAALGRHHWHHHLRLQQRTGRPAGARRQRRAGWFRRAAQVRAGGGRRAWVVEAQAMWPGKACTAGTSWVCWLRAAAPHTPLLRGARRRDTHAQHARRAAVRRAPAGGGSPPACREASRTCADAPEGYSEAAQPALVRTDYQHALRSRFV